MLHWPGTVRQVSEHSWLLVRLPGVSKSASICLIPPLSHSESSSISSVFICVPRLAPRILSSTANCIRAFGDARTSQPCASHRVCPANRRHLRGVPSLPCSYRAEWRVHMCMSVNRRAWGVAMPWLIVFRSVINGLQGEKSSVYQRCSLPTAHSWSLYLVLDAGKNKPWKPRHNISIWQT